MSERSLDYGLRHNPVSITENYSKSLSQNSVNYDSADYKKLVE